MTGRGRWLLVRLLHAVLWLYPPGFRRQFREEWLETHLDRSRATARAGRGPRLVAARAIADGAIGAVVEWAAVLREAMPRDMRIAARGLIRRPSLSLTIILTLALGIGANTAVFTLVDAVLLRPLRVSDPDRLVALYQSTDPARPRDGVPYPTYRDLARATQALDGLAAYFMHSVAVQSEARADVVSACIVTGNYFNVLGVSPRLGRLLAPSDEAAPLASPYVVLGESLWERHFDRDPAAIGRTLRIGTTTFTVVGVAPRGFRGTDLTQSPDLWVPVTMIQGLEIGGMYSGRFSATILTTFRAFGWLQLIGRVRAGESAAAVTGELAATVAAVRAAQSPPPANGASLQRPARFTALPLAQAAAIADRDGVVRFARVLAGVVALILLLACANVALLLMVRGASRRREFGLCAALGASRARLIGLLLIESLMLATGGGTVGVLLGLVFMRGLAAFTLPGGIDVVSLDLSLDPRTLGIAALVSLATTALFGLAPAWSGSRADLAAAFETRVRVDTRSEPRGLLLAVQIAISIVLLVGAALFLRSLRAGLATDLGFNPTPLAAATVELRLQSYTERRASEFYATVIERVRATPGVADAAFATHIPLAPDTEFEVRSSDADKGAPGVFMPWNHVTPRYFSTLGVPLVEGRGFDDGDRPESALIAILNASAARALFPGGSAVGRKIIDTVDRLYTVVGVVADTRYATLAETGRPYLFFPLMQQVSLGRVSVVARGVNATTALRAIQQAIPAADARAAVLEPRRVSDQVDAWLAPQRFGVALLTVFSGLALVIAAVGIYATLAHRVATRRTEIGVRLALGARPGDVIRLVLQRLGGAVATGCIAGLVAALLLGRVVERFLFGVHASDAISLAAALAAMAMVICLAMLRPLRRAVATDPATVMRAE